MGPATILDHGFHGALAHEVRGYLLEVVLVHLVEIPDCRGCKICILAFGIFMKGWNIDYFLCFAHNIMSGQRTTAMLLWLTNISKSQKEEASIFFSFD